MIGAKVWRKRTMKEREKNKLLQQEVKRRKREILWQIDDLKEQIKDILYSGDMK